MTHNNKQPVASNKKSAWSKAIDYGIDTSLIKANLRLTPLQRIRAHQRALTSALNLRQAVKQRND